MPSKDFTPENQTAPPASMLAGLAILLGVAVFSYGFWLAWHPLGFIAAGFSVVAIGVLLGRNAARRIGRSS